MSIDNCTHSFFGTSKSYADLIVQEYGRNIGLKTACFRAGCITGPNHSGAKLHGFPSRLKSSLAETPLELKKNKLDAEGVVHLSQAVRRLKQGVLDSPEVAHASAKRSSHARDNQADKPGVWEARADSDAFPFRELQQTLKLGAPAGDDYW